MPPPFSLIPLTPADFSTILEVYRQCEDFLALGPQPRASLEMVQADFEASRQAGRLFNGILVQDGLAGLLDYLPSGFEGNPEQAYLELLMIAAPFRQQGLGRSVVAWLENRLRQEGRASALLLGVQVNNPAALRFWQRCGFAIAGEPTLYPDGTTARLLRKNL